MTSTELASLPSEPSAPYDAVGAEAVGLTPQQEAFARAVCEVNNFAAAYRLAYGVPLSTRRATVWHEAHRTARLPHVAARIQVLRDELAAKAIITRERALNWLVTQLETDTNELVSYSRYGCRCCHGINFKPQWKDEDEFAAAYVATVDANAAIPAGKRKLALPDDAGGYGYSKGTEPNPLCPECLGNGTSEAIIKDTTKLTGGALALYAGVKETAAGTVLLMHDKSKLFEQLCRMMGWNKDATPGGGLQPPGSQAHAALPTGITEADAAKHYLRLVGGVN